ncbi:Tetraspanin-7 [Nymphon striatum]|nr:Tetraspanin-7 [Nymphon striatum]
MSSEKRKVPENGDVSRKTARCSAQQVAAILDSDDEETLSFDEDYPSDELETDSDDNVDNNNDSESDNENPVDHLPITGIGILAVGIWMKMSLYKYMELSHDYNDIAVYVLIGTGAAMIVCGSMACCCTIKGQSFMLYLFSVFLLMIFLLMLTAGISGYVYRSHLEDGFRVGLNSTMLKYRSLDKTENDKAMDSLQSNLGCCGIKNYKDWFNVPWTSGSKKLVPNSVPFSCCHHQNDKCHYNDLKLNETESIYTAGCYDKVVGFVGSNLSIIGGGILAVAFFQLIGVLLSYCLARNINKGKYEPVD